MRFLDLEKVNPYFTILDHTTIIGKIVERKAPRPETTVGDLRVLEVNEANNFKIGAKPIITNKED